MVQKSIKTGLLLTVVFFTLSCSTPSGDSQNNPTFVEGKGYCVHKYGENGCSCIYQYKTKEWSCQEGPTTVCDQNKSKAGQCSQYVPDLDKWGAEQQKEDGNADQSVSQSN